MAYTLGSLFDGSGGFPLAATLCGMEPKWAAEIEPYPIAVTRSRFPSMKHLGSVTEVHGGEIDPVDVITFGSPCQDLSVAGKRKGLKHTENGDDETTRSGLFMEAVRIIKGMREATDGKQPRFALWENVPGAFSSNKGEDFRIVLEELIKVAEPQAPELPPPGKDGWSYADVIVGDGWSLAWRVFDAQYWGVPQRRRRIHLVADFTDQCAGEVLFEREGVRGRSGESGASGQNPTGDAGSCAQAAGFKAGNGAKARGVGFQEEVSPTLSAAPSGTNQAPTVVYCLQGNGIDRALTAGCNGKGWRENESYTLNAIDRSAVVFDKEMYSSGRGSNGGHYLSDGGPAPTLRSTGCPPGCAVDYVVRRFTPTECARLQGFPDWWGHPDHKDAFTEEELAFWRGVRDVYAEINGKQVKAYTVQQMLKWYNGLHTDSSEYKMWGNGIALPPALYVMQGIYTALEMGDLL